MRSRTKEGIKNIQISFVIRGISLLFVFLSRGLFIKELGVNIVGLSSALLDILGFLNLAELGLTSAISGTLYKPLYENNKRKICDIISIFGYLYRFIGVVILIIGVIISFFLPYFFRKSGVDILYVYCGYYTFLFSSLIGYFISYRQTLLSADQKEYVVIGYMNFSLILKTIFQMGMLKWTSGGYITWLILELVFNLAYALWINEVINKTYPWLVTSFNRGKLVRKEYNDLFHTIKQVIPHNIGAFVLNQTQNIIIYAFTSLSLVTLYTNYTLLLIKTVSFLNLGLRGLTAGLGNLVAEGNKEKIISVFFQFNSFFFVIGGIMLITFSIQTESFITLWLGQEFILDKCTFVLLLYIMYVGVIRLPINYFIGAYVLYKDVWAPIAEASLNLFFSLILGYYWGIPGVVSGSVISLTIIVVLWKPFFLFKTGFGTSVYKYWLKVLVYILTLASVGVLAFYTIDKYWHIKNGNWGEFVFNTIMISLSIGGTYMLILFIIDRWFRSFIKRLISLTFKTK